MWITPTLLGNNTRGWEWGWLSGKKYCFVIKILDIQIQLNNYLFIHHKDQIYLVMHSTKKW
jgi:hypothetical protein